MSTLTKAQENELKRLAERGKTDPDRGKTDPDRGKTDPDRGMGSGPPYVAADIFRRAAGLGGHLVVAFIAPVGSSTARPLFRPSVPLSVSEVAAAAARAGLKIEQATPKPTVTPNTQAPRNSWSKPKD
jgi:hypothetical protein